ncbi:MAG: mechanosensitive ion channel family protein, partial [Methyloligellaceae bacterium]
AAILIGIGFFVLGLFITRLVQRSLTRTFLSPDRMNAGLAHSIRTGVGYAGFALSALIAVSYAGFNFTNLAIVAGALSVGIGFGLQSIVNNFVSGLILLAERPIQVGDWIVVGDKEGYVRQISVRATVIETFDRASLIIPNSDLMTAAVTNWTYGNRLGRVIVKVGTSYDADPKFVHDALLDVGERCSHALKSPPPSAVFENFGTSTLDFSLRIFIADINNVLRAQTELRMEIWKVFRERNIEISFPQLDVHVKNGGAGSQHDQPGPIAVES